MPMPPTTFEELDPGPDHERMVLCYVPSAGYRGIIALHSTVAGPAVGGTRYLSYPSDVEAKEDALRLSRGMTYKNAMAGLPLGGGKSILFANDQADREALFLAHGRFIEYLDGRYIAGEDVGTSPQDMAVIQRETRHVAGLGDSGDPSPRTARGVLQAVRAAARHRWGSDNLSGRKVALQGCGHVGLLVARLLHEAGARLFVTDVSQERVQETVELTGATPVAPRAIYDTEADIFAPCALGGILNRRTIPRLRVEIVAGAANNQLEGDEDGRRLHERGILYAPDYVANAGGVINGCREILGFSEDEARERIDRIYDTMIEVLRLAAAQGITPNAAADRIAEERLAALRKERQRAAAG
jgi:leucine dehydrogenase